MYGSYFAMNIDNEDISNLYIIVLVYVVACFNDIHDVHAAIHYIVCVFAVSFEVYLQIATVVKGGITEH